MGKILYSQSSIARFKKSASVRNFQTYLIYIVSIKVTQKFSWWELVMTRFI